VFKVFNEMIKEILIEKKTKIDFKDDVSLPLNTIIETFLF
jgi:hypothetical protein